MHLLLYSAVGFACRDARLEYQARVIYSLASLQLHHHRNLSTFRTPLRANTIYMLIEIFPQSPVFA